MPNWGHSTPFYVLRKIKCNTSKSALHIQVYYSTNNDSQQTEHAQMPISRWMNVEDVVFINSGELISL